MRLGGITRQHRRVAVFAKIGGRKFQRMRFNLDFIWIDDIRGPIPVNLSVRLDSDSRIVQVDLAGQINNDRLGLSSGKTHVINRCMPFAICAGDFKKWMPKCWQIWILRNPNVQRGICRHDPTGQQQLHTIRRRDLRQRQFNPMGFAQSLTELVIKRLNIIIVDSFELSADNMALRIDRVGE